MVVGLGCDVLEIKRIEKSIQKESFLRHVYTAKEQQMSGGKASFYAGNFAVKEAVSKCFGTGFRGMELTDIEVLRDIYGRPYVNLYGGAKDLAEKLNIKNILVTISNTKTIVMACAVAENK